MPSRSRSSSHSHHHSHSSSHRSHHSYSSPHYSHHSNSSPHYSHHSYSSPHYRHRTVHHVYHVQVPYQCGNCQRSAVAMDWIPQCTACLIQICKDCNNHGFCPEHWNALSPDDQNEIIRMERTPVGRVNPWIICLSVIAILGILPFSLMPLWVGEFRLELHLPLMLGGIFGIMFGIIIMSVVASKRTQKKILERRQWLDDLNAKYNFKPRILQPDMTQSQVTAQPETQQSVQSIPNSSNETYRPQPGSKRCLMCGFDNNDENAAYCNRCGTRL